MIDFIDFEWWPVWNMADAAVVIGAVLLIFAVRQASDRWTCVPEALAGERVDRVVAFLTGLTARRGDRARRRRARSASAARR